MQGYFAIGALVLLIGLVLFRARQLKRLDITAFQFGKLDKKDFLIPPFVLLFFYLIIANTFQLPGAGTLIIDNTIAGWVGVALCVAAPIVFFWGMISFGKSFRVGIDMDTPGQLVISGAFAFSRNPLYLAFFMILFGILIIFPLWIFLAYFVGGLWLIDRQVNLEENALRTIYGTEYDAYCRKVKRYF
ncbi:methyltransferase family protein [Culicoidibacter larvae]|uniref:Isoprenylcysteine carboxylmethyltransferase family protein n=1 Tax=Culicoidibacter larvae TaxID=2579976 RepID=A0A5R8QGF0_9FIRM|nr:isoprenylcysteine carboxylmethyltransferase family protein [Culicoidibacter larvae]TLG77111.1 isoprenylcysteine carboxylmethyltransferase family protein [Culicoidibacter larvae]